MRTDSNYANTNLYQNRHDYTDYDYLSHGAGGFGYSGRLWEASKQDFQKYQAAVQRFKQYRHLLLADYSRPTGQPVQATDYTKVIFCNGESSLTMEFNPPGKKRSAFITHEGLTRIARS